MELQEKKSTKSFKIRFKEWCNKIKNEAKSELKNPLFYIGFGASYILLNSPIIYGVIMYFLTSEEKYMVIAGSWFALVFPTFPIPVIPISLFVGILCGKIGIKNKQKIIYNNDKEVKE